MTPADRANNIRLRYMAEVARRIDGIIALVGEHPAALATLYMRAFVGMARKLGATRRDAENLLAKTWENFEALEPRLTDVQADIESDMGKQ